MKVLLEIVMDMHTLILLEDLRIEMDIMVL